VESIITWAEKSHEMNQNIEWHPKENSLGCVFLFQIFAAFALTGEGKSGRDFLSQQVAQDAEDHAKNDGNQDIGGVVDIEIEPGESDKTGKNQGRNAHTFIPPQEHRGCFKGSNGMS